MSLNLNVSTPPTGARRLTRAMLEVRDRSDRFTGLPPGMAKPLTLLAAFQEAEPYLGLPAQAFKLVAWLVKQTMAHDWEAGSRPIAWPSAKRQQEYLGLRPSQVKMLNRLLFEAGLFVLRDNEQGKRYGRRGADKRIIEAYGFDLSPLAQRYDEFVRVAAAARTERSRVKACRSRITIGRRSIRQAGELLAGLTTPLPAGWPQLATETAELVASARRLERSEDLARIAAGIEERQQRAEQWVREAAPIASEPVDIDPEGPVGRPLTTPTNFPINPSDTVIASEGRSRAEAGRTQPQSPSRRRSEGVAGIRRASQLLELTPRLAHYVASAEPGWPELVAAAANHLRHELGVSASLWGDACGVLGREGAALALAVVSTKPPEQLRSPGGYFAGMVKKARKGELFLERTLWKLRIAKWGTSPSRRLN